jgi:hypothetical protein
MDGQQADAHTSIRLALASRGEVSGLVGRVHTPSWVPHPWGATSCCEAAPSTQRSLSVTLLLRLLTGSWALRRSSTR